MCGCAFAGAAITVGFTLPGQSECQIIIIVFNAGQEMLASWSDPFVKHFDGSSSGGGVRLVELSIVESRVGRPFLWAGPFRLTCSSARRKAGPCGCFVACEK